MKTNLSTAVGDNYTPQYSHLPAQTARIPPSKSTADLRLSNTTPANPLHHNIIAGVKHQRASSTSSPLAQSAETLRDLNLSAEPKIFPGVVSRGQRRESVASRDTSAMEKTPEKGKSRADLYSESTTLEALSDEEL